MYSYNSQTSVTPGSVEKLFTTGVAFSRLGSDFRFVTRIGIRGEIDRDGVLHGNIYIIGGGDPMLGSYRYRQTSPDSLFDGWTKALKKKGIRRVDGRVCYNISIFDEQALHDTWAWGDVGNYYGAGVYGLNFHENMYFVFFNPGTRLGYPTTVTRLSPKNINVLEVNEVTTGPEGSGDNVVIYGSPHNSGRLYRGTVPMGKSEFRVRGAMPNPARQCADLFSSYLRTHGISISSNSMQVYSQPDSMRVVLDYYSSDYYTIAQYTNLTSNNIYAEAIFKYMGYAKYGRGNFVNGSKVVMDFFREKRLEAGGVRVNDGSGLSPQNRVTADFVCRYLMAIGKEPFFKEFLRTLPKVGESGTAKNLLPHLPATVSVRLKTGTMDGVKAYAGYVDAANGDRLAFAIISNGHEVSSAVAGDKLGRILMKIATLY
ncbi:MAG: D-alanyl-D-alanine carboxypeptidase/D-alanyl-D-alanine-endopeptidase [Bacteroidales bacterium]|nr:D-alanyl-D-alanine carboxypeptidase/D-alanyl-D-alanine-endopeptidase [Bacteroidales bacterium]